MSQASEMFEYSCERCKTRFVLPPSSRKLGIGGTFRAFFAAAGGAVKRHESLRGSFGTARREILARRDDEAYQRFVQSFRFCHECRQFVCNDCWSKSRGTCLTCATKTTPSPARVRPVVTAAFAAAPDIPRPIIAVAPQRRGHRRRDLGLAGVMLAIVLLSIEGGVLLLNATTGPADLSPAQTRNPDQSQTPGPTSLRQWIITPVPDTPGTATPGSTDGPIVIAPDTPTPSLAPGVTAPPATHKPPKQPPPPTPKPGELIVIASGGSMQYGGSVPTITATYSGFTGGDTEASLTTKPTCSTVATSSSAVGIYASSCTGAVIHNYVIIYSGGLVDVTPAPLTITASSSSMTYGATPPTISPSYSGFVNGDSAGSLTPPTCSTTANSSSPVSGSPYSSSCTGAASANYAISTVNGTVTVGQASLTYSARSYPVTYGAAKPTVLANYSGLVAGDSAPSTPASCDTTYTQGADVGSYPTTCSGAADPNYSISYAGDGSVSVGTRALHVSALAQTIASGDPAPVYTFQLTVGSFVSPDDWLTGPNCTAPYTAGDPDGDYTITCSATASSNYSVSFSSANLHVGP